MYSWKYWFFYFRLRQNTFLEKCINLYQGERENKYNEKLSSRKWKTAHCAHGHQSPTHYTDTARIMNSMYPLVLSRGHLKLLFQVHYTFWIFYQAFPYNQMDTCTVLPILMLTHQREMHPSSATFLLRIQYKLSNSLRQWDNNKLPQLIVFFNTIAVWHQRSLISWVFLSYLLSSTLLLLC